VACVSPIENHKNTESDTDNTIDPLRKPRDKNDLILRLISALILIPIVLTLVVVGEIKPHGMMGFVGLLIVCVGFISFEWARMTRPHLYFAIGFSIMIVQFVAIVLAHYNLFIWAFLTVLIGAFLLFLRFQSRDHAGSNSALGAIYIGIPAVSIVWLREGEAGLFWVIFAFCMAWVTDSAAYGFGRWLKGPKLWPQASPNKTWAGLIGGLLAGMLSALILGSFSNLRLNPSDWAGIGLLISFCTLAGDMWESAIKRRFGVKDAGHLIPGHGGLLDRVDGLMFAILGVAIVRLCLEHSGLAFSGIA
jgi:phosphatidate cytidylyltransferase